MLTFELQLMLECSFEVEVEVEVGVFICLLRRALIFLRTFLLVQVVPAPIRGGLRSTNMPFYSLTTCHTSASRSMPPRKYLSLICRICMICVICPGCSSRYRREAYDPKQDLRTCLLGWTSYCTDDAPQHIITAG